MAETGSRADWFPEGKIEAIDVKVKLDGDELRLSFTKGKKAKTIDLRQADISAYIKGVPLKITVAGEGVLSIPDGPLAQQIAERSMPAGANVERKPLAYIAAAAAVLFFLAFVIVPAVSTGLAHNMSVATINDLVPDILANDDGMNLDFHSGGWDHEVAEDTIREIGWDLTRSIPEGYNFRFLLERSDGMVNAFAMPDGTIVFGYALYEQLDKEQVAGILAHEIAHVTERHGVEGLLSSTIWTFFAFMMQDATLVLAGLGLGEVAAMSYSRDDEHDADCVAATILVRAGYDPSAIVAGLSRLQELEHLENDGEDFEIGIMSSHPATGSRIRHARGCVNEVG